MMRRTASLTSEVFAPFNIGVAVLIVIGWQSTHSLAGVGWGLLGATLALAPPLALILVGVHRGKWTDWHIPARQQRIIPIVVAAASTLAGYLTLATAGAPRPILGVLAAILVGLLANGLVTLWWKVSGHTTSAAAATAGLVATFGPEAIPLLLLIPLVAWSRVVTRSHTVSQTIAGTAVGLLAAAAYTAVR